MDSAVTSELYGASTDSSRTKGRAGNDSHTMQFVCLFVVQTILKTMKCPDIKQNLCPPKGASPSEEPFPERRTSAPR